MAIDSDDSDRSGERKLKIEKLEGFTILDTIKNIRGSLEEVKISTLIRIWKKLIPDPYGWPWGVQDFSEGNAHVVEIARELDLEVESEE